MAKRSFILEEEYGVYRAKNDTVSVTGASALKATLSLARLCGVESPGDIALADLFEGLLGEKKS